jgi:putative hydrolase of the HAD superfamily
MRKYKHLFFDLDHTLWDFESNSRETLRELFEVYPIKNAFPSFDTFFDIYSPINHQLWEQYRQGLVHKDFLNVERFHKPFRDAGLEDISVATRFAGDFVKLSPYKTALLPHAIEILEYLRPSYVMHIITNGFREVQFIKLEQSQLRPFFKTIVISEMVGAQKPKKAFFEYAIKSANARKNESLVIGDNLEADIIGAKNFGLDQVFFNPSGAPHKEPVTHEIQSLSELRNFL